ncbi:expressed unknown protein [Ectocarpus siliculosus]|uniref:Uncharacterized protein n=1 Tax=Ectocarpus siliculosus TaxID=2880 RepID=D7G7T1_ECTSI|nr:expressed unknown protein [Ectocarpus siliculosus]|eukprot:CBJ27812.1 expressed unknown protein [Ectocarpus siliculosus]
MPAVSFHSDNERTHGARWRCLLPVDSYSARLQHTICNYSNGILYFFPTISEALAGIVLLSDRSLRAKSSNIH